jgi:hypothetical protein
VGPARPTRGTQITPLKYQNSSKSVSYTIKPVAGVGMATRWAVVTRGIRIPLLVAVRSNMAELCGVFVPIPTFCCAKSGNWDRMRNTTNGSALTKKCFIEFLLMDTVRVE